MKKCRLYTGIHALKPKPKFKTGAISESTTALNVDQTNTSVLNVDQKNAAAGAALQLPSPLAPNTNAAAKGAGGQDQPTAVPNSVTETGVGGSTTSTTAPVVQKKEVGLTKVNADKRKMDARKKSLKRL